MRPASIVFSHGNLRFAPGLNLIATLFQPGELGRRSEISARAETPQAESGPNSCFILQTTPDILVRQVQTICQRYRMSYFILLVL